MTSPTAAPRSSPAQASNPPTSALSELASEPSAIVHELDRDRPLIDALQGEDASLFSELYSDEPPLESTLHLQQMLLLLHGLQWLWRDRSDYFAAGNLTIYYSPYKRKREDFRGPDFFVVLDTDPKPRKSWTVWQEDGRYPNIIIELLSSSTAHVDRGLKKQLYAETFRTPEYFWFDPDSQELAGFALLRGQYEPIEPDEAGLLWSEQLQLHLGRYDGALRYFTAEGELLPTPQEDAQSAIDIAQEAEKAAQEAEKAAQEAEKALADEQARTACLTAQLRALGVDPH